MKGFSQTFEVTNEIMGRHKISLVIVIYQLQWTGITKNVHDQDDLRVEGKFQPNLR